MHKYTFKTILLGDTGVGKTTLCNTLMRRQNPDMQYQPTIGIDFNAVIETIYNNTTVKIHLWDTAGQEKYRSIIKSYYRGTCGAILMYDITNVGSFNNLRYWLSEFYKGTNCSHCYNHPVLLLATKCDLDKRRKITYEQGQSFALEHGLIFREVNNYKRSGNVEDGFVEFLREIYNNLERERRGEYIKNTSAHCVLQENGPMITCKGVQFLCGDDNDNDSTTVLSIDSEVKSPSVCTKCDRN